MQSKVTKLDGMNPPQFCESDCSITVEGCTFHSGGAFVADSHAVLYGDWKADGSACRGQLTSWSGNEVFPCHYGTVFHGNMGDRRRYVTASIGGKNYTGLWAGIDNNQLIRMRATK